MLWASDKNFDLNVSPMSVRPFSHSLSTQGFVLRSLVFVKQPDFTKSLTETLSAAASDFNAPPPLLLTSMPLFQNLDFLCDLVHTASGSNFLSFLWHVSTFTAADNLTLFLFIHFSEYWRAFSYISWSLLNLVFSFISSLISWNSTFQKDCHHKTPPFWSALQVVDLPSVIVDDALAFVSSTLDFAHALDFLLPALALDFALFRFFHFIQYQEDQMVIASPKH